MHSDSKMFLAMQSKLLSNLTMRMSLRTSTMKTKEFKNDDDKYTDFSIKTLNNTSKDCMIGTLIENNVQEESYQSKN